MESLAVSAWKIIPQFISRSIPATVDFYTKELGFTLGGVHPDDDHGSTPDMCSVFMGHKAEANIYLFQCKPDDFHPAEAMIALGSTQLDEYHEQLQTAGRVRIVKPIEDMPWGYRQFTVEDPDGNRLTFFKFLEGGNPGEE